MHDIKSSRGSYYPQGARKIGSEAMKGKGKGQGKNRDIHGRTSVRIAHMSRDEVMDGLEQLGWEPVANVAYTLQKKKGILHELVEMTTKTEMNGSTNVCAGLSQKNKTELGDLCKTLSIPSGHETEPLLTRKIKEVLAERQPLRQATLDSRRHRRKTYTTNSIASGQC